MSKLNKRYEIKKSPLVGCLSHHHFPHPHNPLFYLKWRQLPVQIQILTGRDLTTVERMQCGAFSGLFAQTLTYPLEVTRRRMQTIGVVETSGKAASVDVVGKSHHAAQAQEAELRAVKPNKPPSLRAIVTELYAEQGIRSFYKGVTLNWFKGPIAFSISFTAFDTVQMLLETDVERRARLPRRRTTTVATDSAPDTLFAEDE